MKTKNLAIISATALVISLFVACKKSDNNIEIDNQPLSTMATSDCARVDFNAADFVELNNQYVIALYGEVDFSNLHNVKAQILNNFGNMPIDASAFQMSEQKFKDIVLIANLQLANYKYDLRQWSNNPISQSISYSYIIKILDEIDRVTSLRAFNVNLSFIEQKAKANLTCNDLDIVLGTIEVAKNSAKLWAPTSIGGDGLFDYSFGSNAPMQTMSWQRAIIGNASASALHFLTLGVGPAVSKATPGANAAILAGWALAAAVGFACGALGF